MSHIILVLARGGSVRVPRKNLQDICGRPMLHWTLDVAHNTGVADAVVVSTEDDRVRFVAEEYENTEFVMRDLSWSDGFFHDVIDKSLDRYINKSGRQFEYCTVLLGISMFWRPSWIREALTILKTKIASGREPVSHVLPTSKLQNLSFSYRLNCPWYMPYILPHRGINFDIDTPEQLGIARGIMEAIQKGHIPYPIKEDMHQNDDFRDDAELRSHMI